MAALPRGRCPICGHFVALRNHDLVREHRAPGKKGKRPARACVGSGKPKAP